MRKTSLPVLILISLITVLKIHAQPFDYYKNTENLHGEVLKQALHQIIKGHIDYSYTRSADIINYTDADTANPDNVILFYLQQSRDADLYGQGGNYINREHVWAKSHGDFSGIRPMDSDVHNLRPADASVNEDRGNKDFDNVQPNGARHAEATECWYSESAWEPGPATKGQVARILFYMATRYEGGLPEIDLELADRLNTSPLPLHGKLSTLLEWNNLYPPSPFERRRNERIFQIQQNRNPFVDNPDLANRIWNNQKPDTTYITGVNIEPQVPCVGDTLKIVASFDQNIRPDSLLLFYGKSYHPQTNPLKMTLESNRFIAQFPLNFLNPDDLLYIRIKAFAGDNSSESSASYVIPGKVSPGLIASIQQVQGIGTESPMTGNKVTISGRITANFDNTVYIQDKSSPRSGICIFNSLVTGNTGDSVAVSGTVEEYASLTELTNIEFFYNYRQNKTVEPILLNCSQIGEDYEGMLVSIHNAAFDEGGAFINETNRTFSFYDDFGQSVIYSSRNSRLPGSTLPMERTSITGIVSQYQGGYQILPRDISDLAIKTNLPEISSPEAEITVFPIPTNDLLNIKTHVDIRLAVIYSITGKICKIIHGHTNQVDVSSLINGIYFIRMETSDDKYTYKKIVISR